MSRGGFSWKRAIGISKAKSRISRTIGIPLTRSGRQRKVGAAIGCSIVPFVFAISIMVILIGCSTRNNLSYEVIGEFGAVKTVYMPIEQIQDQNYIGRVLGEIVDPSEMTIQVDFFDDINSTPGRYPMTDTELAHWRAQYNFNRDSNYERFIYITNGNLEKPTIQTAPVRPIRD